MKKDKSRFTLRLNTISPKHINATDVLTAAGKGMSSLIADLIDERIKRDGENAFVDYFRVSALPQDFFQRATFPQTVVATTISPVQISEAAVETVKHIPAEAEDAKHAILDADPSNDEVHNAILDGLSMFGSG